jgi:hypothetical protein
MHNKSFNTDHNTENNNIPDACYITFYRMEEDEHKGNCDSAGLSRFFLGHNTLMVPAASHTFQRKRWGYSGEPVVTKCRLVVKCL